MTAAGRRDKLVTFQRATTAADEFHEEIEVWAPIGKSWAAVYFGRGEERRQAGREEGGQTGAFVVLSDSLTRSITIAHRIEMDGDWDIKGISPDTPKRGEIEFIAQRAM